MDKYIFNGEHYNDDRLFVLFVQKCTIKEDDEFVITKLHHGEAPKPYKWCVATFRNVSRYRAYRVDSFDSKEEANQYLKEVEPETPLISLNGHSMNPILTFTAYKEWKKKFKLKEYDYKKMFDCHKDSNTTFYNPVETLYKSK